LILNYDVHETYCIRDNKNQELHDKFFVIPLIEGNSGKNG